MPQVQATAQVNGSPEEIFNFLADYQNIPKLQPHFDSAKLVGNQEQGAGAIVELKGHFHGVPMHARNRIVTFTPPYRLVSISDGTVLSRNTWELRPAAGNDGRAATEVSFTIEYKIAAGPLGGLFTGLTSSLFHREIQSLTDESLRRLRAIFAPES
jgi:ribosome-associated toxin RatA of RatAB toxin-antitoxin module